MMMEPSIRSLGQRTAIALFRYARLGPAFSWNVSRSSSTMRSIDVHMSSEKAVNLLTPLFDKIDIIESHVSGLEYDGRLGTDHMFEKMIEIETQVAELQQGMAQAKQVCEIDAPESDERIFHKELVELEDILEDAAARVFEAHTKTRGLVSLASLVSTEWESLIKRKSTGKGH